MRNKNELLESMTQNNIKEMNLVKKKKKFILRINGEYCEYRMTDKKVNLES